MAGRDFTDAPLDVEGADIADVVVTLTDQRPAGLSGTVRDARGDADLNAVVFVFPADRQFWSYLAPTSSRFKTSRVSANGAYALSGFPEGEYFAIAGPEERLHDWLQPRVLEVFAAQATRVNIGEAEQRTLDLTRSIR